MESRKIIKAGLIGVTAFVLAVTGVAFTGKPASAATGSMKFRNSNYCVDVNQISGPVGNGTKIQAWQCNGGAAQMWYDTVYTSSGNFSLRNPQSGRCLDVDQLHGPVGNGTKVQLWQCNYGHAQQWRKIRTSYVIEYYNPSSGKCLDLPGSGYYNGNWLQIWDCNNTLAQHIDGPGVVAN
ncbi:ricin-type beta-trefoil lectin domain protein [Candidatus Saccharibacteria bacterium]|nr:ricin-type beta-trefoil lectin domain protein [Candidatus Saccharibacteria bacterium]